MNQRLIDKMIERHWKTYTATELFWVREGLKTAGLNTPYRSRLRRRKKACKKVLKLN